MDITLNELKTMKIKQLRRLISEAVKEVINEETYAGKEAVKDLKSDQAYGSLAPDAKQNAEKELQKGGSVTLEGEIDEMARIAKGFRLTDPNLNTSTYTKSISGTPLSAILDYFRENPGADVKSIQTQFNFVRPQIANGLVKGLLDAGVLTKLTAGGEVVAPVEPGEEAPVQATEPEDLFMGSAENPLSMYFDNEPNNDGSEDFNAEEEPTTGELEPASTATGNMSDEDYDAWMKWSDLNDRLSATKSNILKAKRNKKGGVAGDISDTSGSELPRLTTLKQSLEDRMNALVAKSKYLQSKIEKETGKSYEPIETDIEDEEDTIDEAFNKEYEMRKLQYYAGIKK
jgi:hypothetical protein